MSDDDMMQALGRIERALSRIEAIEQASGDQPHATDAGALATRHDRLRGQVRATLERLDALIGAPAELMARATVYVAGRRYDIACRDGEEARFEALARLVDQKARVAVQGLGGVNEARQLLLAALLLADDVQRGREDGGGSAAPDIAPALGALAERIESLATRLEKTAPTA